MAQQQVPKGGSRTKHVPQRSCVACRRSDAKRGLVRIVRTPEGRVEIDLSGKRNGRGAYVCRSADCWELALKRRSIERALRVEKPDPTDVAALIAFADNLRVEHIAGAPDSGEAAPAGDDADRQRNEV